MKSKLKYIVLIFLLLLSIIAINAYSPIRTFVTGPSIWSGDNMIKSIAPEYDSGKKTVFVIADHKLTEMFDMLAPFYLFNATEKANVYIVANEKTPIWIKKDLYVSPQLTFREVDSLQLPADVIVIPALSIRDEHQDPIIVNWIKNHFSQNTKMLTICDGASTGAATGLYDGKPITAHASDFEGLKVHFDKPQWVQQVSVTKSGNLFSTAGVSNAVEGSLAVIEELFGTETVQRVSEDINYPHNEIKYQHKSIALSGNDKFVALKKVLFKNNNNIGVLLENGINEFTLATILDTYNRTLPASFKTFIVNDSTIRSKYGLAFIYTGDNETKGLDELHLLMPEAFSNEDSIYFGKVNTVKFDNMQRQYPFDFYFDRIAEQYGHQFEKFVRISLDYN
jgi:transcriptional regulator GlxA family with amidase domain